MMGIGIPVYTLAEFQTDNLFAAVYMKKKTISVYFAECGKQTILTCNC